MISHNTKKIIATVGVSLLAGLSNYIGHSVGYARGLEDAIPKVDKVQENFVPTNNLEIRIEDMDHSDGKRLPETYINIGDSSYVLMYDRNGRPILKTFSFKIEREE